MKALTVQQPWAWAIIHGGKSVENRTQLWKYRGPLAIHAGARWSERGAEFEPLQRAYAQWLGFTHWEGTWGGYTALPIDPRTEERDRELIDFRAIIGTVDVVDTHWSHPDCCGDNPWAEQDYIEHGGRKRTEIAHLVLETPRAITPIECSGRLGLWNVPDDLAALVGAA